MKKILFSIITVLILSCILVGCREKNIDKYPPPPPIETPEYPDLTPHFPMNVAQRKLLIQEYNDMINRAGLIKYAELGQKMQREGRVKFVVPPRLDSRFNAYANIGAGEIWLNKPMYDRYPRITHQATIFLHELIHIDSKEMTHRGEWWSAQDEFAVWCNENYDYEEISTQSLRQFKFNELVER